MNKRPLSVTIIGCLFAAAALVRLAVHLTEFKVQHPSQYDILWIALIHIVAILAGVYMLRGSKWARWFYVDSDRISHYPQRSPLAVQVDRTRSAIGGVWVFLLRHNATQYFRSGRAEASS